MKRKLTVKQKNYIDKYLETQNATESVAQVYNVKNRNMARVIAFRNMRNPQIVGEIEKRLEKVDITDDMVMQKYKEGMEATVVTNYKGEADETSIADHNVRHKFLQDVAKMKGWLKNNDTETKVNIDMEVENMDQEAFTRLLTNLIKGKTYENRETREVGTAGEDVKSS